MAKNAFNTIHILMGMDDVEGSSPDDMGRLAVNHFQSILAPPMSPATHSFMPELISLTKITC